MPIPLELLLAGRDLTEPKVSPDGSTVAFVQRWRGVSAIMSVPISGGPERIVTTGPDPAPGRGLGGGCFEWLPDGSGLVYAAIDGELWLQSFDGSCRQLTTFERSCRAPSVAPNGEFVVVAIDEAEVWWCSLIDDEVRRLDDAADAFVFDPAVAPRSANVVWQAWSPPWMPWDAAHVVTAVVDDSVPLTRWRPDEAAVQQPGFAPDGSRVCVHDASGWLNVYADDAAVLPETFEQAGPSWGMGQRSFVMSPDGERVALCRNERGFGRLVIVDRTTGQVTNVGKGGHGQLGWSGDTIVALRTGAVTPTQVVAYDVSDLSVKPPRTVLAVGPSSGWRTDALPEPELIEVEHDGTVLHARRYRASGERMLVWVHGGPTDQWQAEWRPRISYWWSRGWDVLVVDPRGTTGHGRDYQMALHGAWGRLDVDDTAALIRQVQVDDVVGPEQTFIIGGSSGGLTVLGLLADHSDCVAAGVASYPVADLASLADVSHRFEAHYTDTLVGDTPFTDLSPIDRADRIGRHVLLFHGTEDPVVPLSQSERIAAAMRAAGGDVELVVYEGEGHGFRDPVNVRDEYERTERFLAERLQHNQG